MAEFCDVFVAPASAPRDLTPVGVPKNPTAVTLSWQPPRQANGLITGNPFHTVSPPCSKCIDWAKC